MKIKCKTVLSSQPAGILTLRKVADIMREEF